VNLGRFLRFSKTREILPARIAPSSQYNSYCGVDTTRELRQGEIISNLTYYAIGAREDDPTQVETTAGTLSFAIIFTPDCDLLQDYKSRLARGSHVLFNVLLFGAEEALKAKDRIKFNSKEWGHVVNNEMERFHYMKSIKTDEDKLGQGLPDLVVDFKRYFTLQPQEIYRQCRAAGTTKAHRRCRLSDLWREDLQRRGMSYMQRVGLPDPSDVS
jgi:hypothetical protein